ncbi:mycothiol transferase [Saccharothrix sp. Mg75]|uniref:mycothiol transferase n=1 Tax=Saccharothrix sp. Mg75 TaxID=3445357 RepID=UPI003EEA2570
MIELTAVDVLVDGFGRVRESVERVLDGLDRDRLAHRVDGSANSIAWLVWHLTRVQDDHVAEVAGAEQVWTAGGWAGRFDLPLPPEDTGYGHSGDQVALVVAPADLLLGYHRAVHEATTTYLRGVTSAELGKVVDDSWDPPVTLAVRLVSVVEDDLQHVGQAAFARGLLPS